MNKTLGARIKHKKDTNANWGTNNPVLLNGEIVLVVMDSGEIRMKVGDGSTRYSALPFFDDAIIASIDAKIAEALTNLNIGFANGEADMTDGILPAAEEVSF